MLDNNQKKSHLNFPTFPRSSNIHTKRDVYLAEIELQMQMENYSDFLKKAMTNIDILVRKKLWIFNFHGKITKWDFFGETRPLKITEKVSFNIARKASYVYILSGQKVHYKVPKMIKGEFLKIWSLRSISVTRQVSSNRTKIGGKCQSSKISNIVQSFKNWVFLG